MSPEGDDGVSIAGPLRAARGAQRGGVEAAGPEGDDGVSIAGQRVAAADLRAARAYLLRTAEPPAPALVGFVAEHGPLVAAERVAEGRVPAEVAAETSARKELRLGADDLAAAERFGARLIIPEDAEWPAWPLLALDVASGKGLAGVATPLALWARGPARLDVACERAVAVVGARAATAYGEQAAADLGYGLAGQGIPVFSGAAYGIDGAAHRGALAAGGGTVAVLGCGLDAGYPAGHASLLEQIADKGLVLSEYPPGTPPARHRFLVRNRLIAGLTGGTVVVEAGVRSGARNTAGTAGGLGKVVMAVPGPIGSAMSVGCHRMLRSAEATLVASVADVLDTVGPFDAEQPDTGAPRRRRRTDGLGRESLLVHEALGGRRGRSTEQVCTDSGVPLDRVRAILPALEMEGLAERTDAGWRKARGDA